MPHIFGKENKPHMGFTYSGFLLLHLNWSPNQPRQICKLPNIGIIFFNNCILILKVDTFKIKTKKLGSLHSIEIGHDGKGFGKYSVFNSLANVFCLRICLTFGKVFEVTLLLQLADTNPCTDEVSFTALAFTPSVYHVSLDYTMIFFSNRDLVNINLR